MISILVIFDWTTQTGSSVRVNDSAASNAIGPQVDEGGVIQNGNPGGNYVR